MHQPSLEEFLHAPIENIKRIAPSTLLFNAGGTRRDAAVAKIPANQYADYSFQKMVDTINLLDKHGFKHTFHTVLSEGNYKEKTKGYRENIVHWMFKLIDNNALAMYKQFNWRMRVVGTESWPGLEGLDEKLREATRSNSGITVWLTVNSNSEAPWQQLLQTCSQTRITSREEAIQAIYGEPIPLANIFIGFGKPKIFASIVSPLLIGKLDCYWRQRPGYTLTQDELRTILYDHIYLRGARHHDNTGIEEQAIKYSSAWNNPSILGVGTKLGPYWYPKSFIIPQDLDKE